MHLSIYLAYLFIFSINFVDVEMSFKTPEKTNEITGVFVSGEKSEKQET